MESTDDNREQAAAAAAEGEATEAAASGADEQEPQEETAAAESAASAEPAEAPAAQEAAGSAEPKKADEADDKQAAAIPGSENVEVITPEEAALAEDPLQGERDDEEFQRLIEMYDESIRNLKEGEIVPGTVIGLTENEVIIDVGYKSEGLVSRSEFTTRDGELTVEVGDEVDVLLEKTEDQEGHVLLSRQKAERMKRWNEIELAYKESSVIEGRVVDRIKGGLTIDVGLRAFLPGSLVDIKPVKNLESLKGETLEFKVISLDRRRNNVVLSRKAVLEKEFEKKKAETLTKLKPGALLPGVVKNITDYGVFIDLGGIDGLLHITDISWGRVNHPSEHFSVGDDVEVVILKFDPETERVSLGYKQRTEDPWNLVDKKYPIGSRVHGRVVSLVDYGAFVEIEEGVEGLIHVSEMSWTKKVVNPSKLLSVGDEVEAIVSELDMDQRRISLSLRQTERNPWEELADQFPEGSIIEGKVRNLTDFGAFVEITEGIDGLIHVSDMSWTKRVKHPSEVLQKGDVVKARITNIDTSNQRVSLSIKEFMPNEWEDFIASNRVGDTLTGRVVNVTDFGLFIDIYQGLEGLAHISEIDLVHGRLEDQFNTGQWVNARILRIEDDEKKVGLTMRGVVQPTADEIMELEEQTKDDEETDESPEEREQAEAIVKAAGSDDEDAEEAEVEEVDDAEEAEEAESDDGDESAEEAEKDDGDEKAEEDAEEVEEAEAEGEEAEEAEDDGDEKAEDGGDESEEGAEKDGGDEKAEDGGDESAEEAEKDDGDEKDEDDADADESEKDADAEEEPEEDEGDEEAEEKDEK